MDTCLASLSLAFKWPSAQLTLNSLCPCLPGFLTLPVSSILLAFPSQTLAASSLPVLWHIPAPSWMPYSSLSISPSDPPSSCILLNSIYALKNVNIYAYLKCIFPVLCRPGSDIQLPHAFLNTWMSDWHLKVNTVRQALIPPSPNLFLTLLPILAHLRKWQLHMSLSQKRGSHSPLQASHPHPLYLIHQMSSSSTPISTATSLVWAVESRTCTLQYPTLLLCVHKSPGHIP